MVCSDPTYSCGGTGRISFDDDYDDDVAATDHSLLSAGIPPEFLGP